MTTIGIQIAAALLMVAAAAIAIFFKFSAQQKPIPKRSQFEPTWLSSTIAFVATCLGVATFWSIIVPNPLTQTFVFQPFDIPCIGLFIGVAGCVLMYASLSMLGNNFSGTSGTYAGHKLITSGPYRYIRHPYYTATAAIVAGLALLLGSFSLFSFGGLLLVCLVIRSRAEERELSLLFRDEYKNWEATTGRFLPRILPPK